MELTRKRWLLYHGAFVVVALAFAGYAFLINFLFPNGFFHCFLYDVLRLYCPFCGGTRAFMALLRWEHGLAFRLCGGVLLWALFFLALDIRALVIFCRREKAAVFPKWLGWGSVLYFTLWTLIRNTAMLAGFDPADSLYPHWQGRIDPWQIVLFALLATLTCACFWGAVNMQWPKKHRPFLGFASLYGLITTLWVLLETPLVAIAYLPATAGAILFYILIKRKNRRA